MPDYTWLGRPESDEAPAAIVADFRELAQDHQEQLALARWLGLTPEDYLQQVEAGVPLPRLLKQAGKTYLEYQRFQHSLHQPVLAGDEQAESAAIRFAAEVEFTTGRQILRVRSALDRGFRKWAAEAAESHLYRYHGREFESFDELMQAVFEDLPESSTTRFDATFIATQLVPFARKHGLEHVERMWGDGTVEKARAAVPLLRGLVHQGEIAPEHVAQVQAIVTDVLALTGSEFKKKYKPLPGDGAPLDAIDYVESQGGTLLISYRTPLDRLTLERRLGDLVDIHHGTGHERVLEKLARVSSKAKRRTRPNPLAKIKRRPRKDKR
jgi:hypothetical protein